MKDYILDNILAKAATSPNILTCAADDALHSAAALMVNRKCTAILIKQNKKIIGILTENELITALANEYVKADQKIADFVSQSMLTVNENDSLLAVRKVMIKHNSCCVAVLSANNNLLGIIHDPDLLTDRYSAYVEQLASELENKNTSLKSSLKSIQLLQKIIENSSSGILVTDANVKIQTCNPAFTKITGYTEEEVRGKKPSVISSGRHDKDFYTAMWNAIIQEGYWEGEIWNRRKNGEIYPELLTIVAIRDNNTHKITNYAAIFNDISQNKQNEEEIHRLTFYDSLTQLPNRSLFSNRLGNKVAQTIRLKKNGALIFIGLDNFSHINETLGYLAGDTLLQEVACRMKKIIRDGDMVARLGSDQFVIILSNLNMSIDLASHDALKVANKIQETISKVYTIENQKHYLSSSIGITLFSKNCDVPDYLVNQANTAMLRAKTNGKNGIQFFHPSMQESVNSRVTLENGLRDALQNNHFQLYFQPQVDHLGNIIGAEALLRWNHPEQGFISPAKFIPIAEQCGLIIQIGDWVLQQAFIHLSQWQKQHINLPHLAINISPRQFYQDNFFEKISRLLVQYQIKADMVMLEITEGLLMDDINLAIEKMQLLKKLGFTFSIDDFGTGYSSLSYLKHLPIDQLKIDKVFVEDISNSHGDPILVETIISMAKHMKLDIIAEGVEVKEELAFLETHGCHCYQGYFFSKALPADQFVDYCIQRNTMSN